MIILSKIWSIIKSIFAAFTKEPENSQLDVGIPVSEDDVSTDAPASVDAPVADPVTDPAPVPTDVVQDPNQSN